MNDLRIIIVEGPRGSGKTTLTKRIEELGYERMKFERTNEPSCDMVKQIGEMMEKGGKYVIDRFHLTEFVLRAYDMRVLPGKLLNDTKAIQFALRVLDARVVVLDASDDLLSKRILADFSGRVRAAASFARTV